MTELPQFDLPLFDPEVMRNPYPYYRELRTHGEVVRNPSMFGALMVTSYAAARGVLTDHQAFSSDAIGSRNRTEVFEAKVMLDSDPPDHERLRGTVARAFTPRAVAGLEPHLRQITADLLQPLRDGDVYDVPSQLAGPLPVMAISQLLGVSVADRDDFRRWSNQLIAGSSELADDDAVATARDGATHLKDYFREVIAHRRSNPGDDLVSRLVAANEGNVLSDAELLSACVLLLVAGNETTTNLITNMALALGRHPDQRQLVVDDPALAASAVAEVARYDSPVQATARVSATDTAIAGHDIAAGEFVSVMVGCANHDPEHFVDPDRLDVTRAETTPALAFGHGIHFCLGAGLARLESRVALEGLLAAAPEYELTCDSERLDYGASFIFHSPKQLAIAAKG